MKRIGWVMAVSLAGAALAAGTAFAVEDMMAGMYGNTLVMTYTNGGVDRYHYTPDGRYTATLADGSSVKGKWQINEGKLCETPDGGATNCYPFGPHKVGDSWSGYNGLKLEVKAGTQ